MYVHKFLADAGMGSRRKMIEAMKAGKVKVNGRTTQDPTFQIDPHKDKVSFYNQAVKPASGDKVYVMLNKPPGYVTTVSDELGRPTVMSLVPPSLAKVRLFPVGRLDVDTEGLLVLTNDGDLTYELTHPKFQHIKEYEVTIARTIAKRDQDELRRGVILEDGRTSPARLEQIHASQLIVYRLTIHEGKKRQVRRMFEHIGHRVLQLKRTRLARLYLDPRLEPGQAKILTPGEAKLLM